MLKYGRFSTHMKQVHRFLNMNTYIVDVNSNEIENSYKDIYQKCRAAFQTPLSPNCFASNYP
jgi:hypothetical protein